MARYKKNIPNGEDKQNKSEKIKAILLVLMAISIVGIGVFFVVKNTGALARKDTPKVSQKMPQDSSHPVLSFTIEKGQDWGALKSPIQVLPYRNNMFVSDSGNSRILVFDLKGKFLYEFEKGLSKENRRLRLPYGLAGDNSGNVYVADMDAGKVMVFDIKGNYLRDFAPKNKEIIKPAGVFVQQDRVYITDVSYHQVYVFDTTGNLLFTIGSGDTGNTNEDFYFPNVVSVDKIGKIYVADSMNNRIQIFSSAGKYLNTISAGGKFKLLNPRGLAFDSVGNLFVASTLNNSVKAFNSDGQILFELIKDKDYTIGFPVDIHIDQLDNLYIADRGSNQIMVFKR